MPRSPPANWPSGWPSVKFERYAEAPGYSEGPTWRNGEVFFCSGALLRVDAKRKVHKYLEINPAGTVLRGDGHLLICDNKYKALLDLSPDGKVGVVAEQFETATAAEPERPDDRCPRQRLLDRSGRLVAEESRRQHLPRAARWPRRSHCHRAGVSQRPRCRSGEQVSSTSSSRSRKRSCATQCPADNELLGKAEVFYDLGGSGGDGCAFDAAGNLWVADFHRPETGKGRITVLSPAGQGARLSAGAGQGGQQHRLRRPEPRRNLLHDRRPAGRVSRQGRREGLCRPSGQADCRSSRYLERRAAAAARRCRRLCARSRRVAAEAKLDGERFDAATREEMQSLAGRA